MYTFNVIYSSYSRNCNFVFRFINFFFHFILSYITYVLCTFFNEIINYNKKQYCFVKNKIRGKISSISRIKLIDRIIIVVGIEIQFSMYAACLESFIFLSRYKYKRVHVPLFHSLRVSFRNGRWHFIIITLLSFVVMFEIANYLLRILAYKFIWPWRLSYGLKKIETLPGVSPPLSVFLKLKNDSFRRYIYI